jgi:alkylation response protein AidB-like acyl-CoA dehydrogenase
MGTLGMERGAALIPMQLAMEQEVLHVVSRSCDSGGFQDPRTRQRLADAYIATHLMRATTLRVVSGLVAGRDDADAAAATSKLFASVAHQRLGELAMDVEGPAAQVLASPLPDGLSFAQRIFLLSRAETIYGGTSEIQRNIISERVLGLPRQEGSL